MDKNTNILLIVICSFISTVLFCSCSKIIIDYKRTINFKNRVKRIYNNLKRKKVIKPVIFDLDETKDEMKDERENEMRFTEPTTEDGMNNV